MNTSVAAVNERDFSAQLADDPPTAAGTSPGAANVEGDSASPGTQLLRRLFDQSYGTSSGVPAQAASQGGVHKQPAHRFDAQDLYVGGRPSAADIDQDAIGDCYLLAVMGALADRQPDRIRNAIQFDPATGNYTVTLHKKEWGWLPPGFQTKEVKMQVTQQEIVDNLKRGGGSTVDNRLGTDKPIWPAVMETAYAKLHDDNHADGLSQGYREIDGDWPDAAMFALTGNAGQNASAIGRWDSTTNANQLELRISKALAEGRAVTLTTDFENRSLGQILTFQRGKQDGLVDKHVYVVNRIFKDSSGDVQVELRNPWGHNNNVGEGKDTPSATITVSLKELIETGGLDYFNAGPK